MLHPGPPQYSIGQEIEITDGDTGEVVLAGFVEDAWYDADLNITSYLLTDKPFFAPDLNDLFNRDTNRD